MSRWKINALTALVMWVAVFTLITMFTNAIGWTDVPSPDLVEVLVIYLLIERYLILMPMLDKLTNEIKDKQNDHSNQNP